MLHQVTVQRSSIGSRTFFVEAPSQVEAEIEVLERCKDNEHDTSEFDGWDTIFKITKSKSFNQTYEVHTLQEANAFIFGLKTFNPSIQTHIEEVEKNVFIVHYFI